MNSTFKKVALASALLASSAMVAPAYAVSGTIPGSTTNPAYIAPVLDMKASTVANGGVGTGEITPVLGAGKKIEIALPQVAAAGGTPKLSVYAYYYDSSFNLTEIVKMGDITTSNTATNYTQSHTVASNSSYAKVQFVIQNNDATNAITINGDTTLAVNGGAYALTGLVAVDTDGSAAVGTNDVAMQMTWAPVTLTGTDAAKATAVKAVSGIKTYDVVSTYAGPVIESAQQADTNDKKPVTVTFNTALKALSNTETTSTFSAMKSSDNTTSETTFSVVLAATPRIATLSATGGGDFANNVNLVKVLSGTQTTLTDLAGNPLAFPASKSVVKFEAPAYATTGKQVLATATNMDADQQKALYTTDGTKLTSTKTLTLSIRMKEAIASGFGAAGDFALSTGLTGGTASGTGTVLTVTGADMALGYWRVNATSGVLQYGGNGASASWPADNADGVTLTLKSETGSKITTAAPGSKSLDADLAAVKIVSALAPTPVVATADNDANGVLDGATIDFKAPLTTTLPATTGVTVTKLGDTTKTAAPTLSVSGNTLKVVVSEDTLGSFLKTDQSKAANLNTGSVGASGTSAVPYQVGVSSSDITYSTVYNLTDGGLKKIDNINADAPATDGASPVILSASYVSEEGNTPAAGQLKIVASEALSTEDTDGTATTGADALDLQQFLIGGSPLTLLNLNDNVTGNAQHYTTGEKTTIAGDTVLLGKTGSGNGKVTASVLSKALAVSTTSKSGLKDGNGNKLAGGVSSIGTGGTTFSGPKIVQAIGTRSSNAVDGNIDQVVVKFDKAVALASNASGSGKVVDGMFKVRATVDSKDYTVAVPAAKTTISTEGYVILDIPTPGIVGSTKLTKLVVEYDANGTDGTATSATLNRLVSTDSTPTAVAEAGTAFGTNDDDTRAVQFSANSTKLYTMEVTGKLTTNGTAAAAKGTIIRADLVDVTSALATKSGSLTVPCSCTAGSTTLALSSPTSLDTALKNAAKLGKASIPAYAVVTLDNKNTATATAVSLAATAPTSNLDVTKIYPVTVSVAGQVTGTAGVTGTLVREKTPGLDILNTVYQVTNDGTFRFAVGSDTAPDDAFVLVSSKQPNDKFFTGLTSPVQSFANYLPFASNVTASGTIGGVLDIDLSKIAKASVSESAAWQLVGFQGTVKRNSIATLKAKGVDMTRLLITPSQDDGAPVTAWAFDNDADDEAFLLLNNVTSSALQIGKASVDGVKDIDGGFALALKNKGGEYTNSAGNDVTISADKPFSVFYPITGDSTPFGAAAGKWSLLTMDTAVTSMDTWTKDNKVAAIIVVGSGNAQKSWFKGSTTNTLTALSKGDRAFIYFEAANAAFKFGR